MNNLLFYCLGVIAVYLLVVVEKTSPKEKGSEKDTSQETVVYNGDNPKPPTTTPPTQSKDEWNLDQAQQGLLTPIPSSPMHQEDGNYKG